MYKIIRPGTKLPKALKNTFASYDKARQAIRKWIILQCKRGAKMRSYGDKLNRTVTIGRYGFGVAAA